MAVPWLQQRAGISITGDGADSHDDFKPVHKGDAGVSVQEHIERVTYVIPLQVLALRLSNLECDYFLSCSMS